MFFRRILPALLLVVFVVSPALCETGETSPRPQAWWVWFEDKGPGHDAGDDNAAAYPPYLAAVAAIAPIRNVTRWFNGASVLASDAQLPALRALPFVREVSPVIPLRGELPVLGEGVSSIDRPARSDGLAYGHSIIQNQMIRADSLHTLGLNGQGILVAVLDAGFDYGTHPALAGVQIDARRDFVDGDTVVAGDSHGSEVLSCLGGYSPGNLIGPAFGARFVLARTEFSATESRSEEDYWLAAAEWADSLGARVISSSVGYNYFDNAAEDHPLRDLDGKTSLITQAAQKAAGRGIVVVNCAGNERPPSNYWNGKLLMPADGDSVIAVGAVNSSRVVTSFSSYGPTADGRIKPDIVALGQSVYMVSGPLGYKWWDGTSYSTPLVAGVVAQLLQAHPAWGPIAVRTALRLSGTHALMPDTTRGWGVINAVKALAADSAVFGKVTGDLSGGPANQTTLSVVNGEGTVVRSGLVSSLGWFLYEKLDPGTYRVRAEIAPLSMAAETTLVLPMLPREIHLELKPYSDVKGAVRPEGFWVGQPHPNPANPGTQIAFRLPEQIARTPVAVRIVSATGQTVLEASVGVSGTVGTFTWDGSDEVGRQVASGVYLIRFTLHGAVGMRAAAVTRRVVVAR